MHLYNCTAHVQSGSGINYASYILIKMNANAAVRNGKNEVVKKMQEMAWKMHQRENKNGIYSFN